MLDIADDPQESMWVDVPVEGAALHLTLLQRLRLCPRLLRHLT